MGPIANRSRNPSNHHGSEVAALLGEISDDSEEEVKPKPKVAEAAEEAEEEEDEAGAEEDA